MAMGKYGKDRPAQSSESFIGGALVGNTGGETNKQGGYQNTDTSNEIMDYSVSRPDQDIKTPFALDNVGRVYDRFPTSMKDMTWAGNYNNLAHSLTGASAVQDKVGDKSDAKKTIIPNH
jgi:hypothetical protein